MHGLLVASDPNFISLSAFAHADLPIRECFPFTLYPSKFNRPSGPSSENIFSVLLGNIRYMLPCAVSLRLLPPLLLLPFPLPLLLFLLLPLPSPPPSSSSLHDYYYAFITVL